jgi:aminoglycoside 3-N-acetyltransferase
MSNKLSEQDFYDAVKDVVLPDDEVIVIYAGIWSFAHNFGGEIGKIPDMMLDVIEDVVGKERTLLFPSFCASDFVKHGEFDLTQTLPRESGVLSKYALKRKGYVRTYQPLHSFLVRGPRAQEILDLPCTSSWGEDSVLAWMGSVNARILALGMPFHQACSYFHKIEEELKVPYRYFKSFRGIMYDKGNIIGPCKEVKYSYSLNCPLDYDFSIITSQLYKQNVILSSQNPIVPLKSVRTSDIDIACHEVFDSDHYAVVVNKKEVKEWVKNGKQAEIAALSPENSSDKNT